MLLEQSFNPICEPVDDWPCKFDENLNLGKSRMNSSPDQTISRTMTSAEPSPELEDKFSFSCEPLSAEDDDEVTESKIKAFLDEKVLFYYETIYLLTLVLLISHYLFFLFVFFFKSGMVRIKNNCFSLG